MVIGSDKVYAIENLYVKHIKKWDKDIAQFPAQSIFYDHYDAGIINKLLFKAGLSPIIRNINKLAKEQIEQFMPDVIWIFKGMEIFPETLRWAKSKGIKLANYNPDNPFIFSGKGSGNKNVTESIGLFDLHFTYNLEVKKEIEERYKIPVSWLPFGFEVEDELYNSYKDQEEILKVCFLGNPDKARAGFIQQMAESGLKIDIYGNFWNKFITHPNVTIFQPVYAAEFWKVLHKYRVQLNLMREHNLDSHNMRTFEVPGTSGILLAPATKEHLLFFEDNKEAFFYSDLKEAVIKAEHLLNMPKDKAKLIRASARNRSISSGYSYGDRAKFVFETLTNLKNA
jgi:spore maturation protein CgeB